MKAIIHTNKHTYLLQAIFYLNIPYHTQIYINLSL